MCHEMFRQKSPEEEELEAKQKVLSELEEEMASRGMAFKAIRNGF